MAAILGISAYYHDSAAALLIDGEILAAAQEERLTRIKHDPSFPSAAVNYCLTEAGLTPADLDHVGFYDKPFLKFERLLETYVATAPLGLRSFFKSIPVWLQQKLHLPREMRKALGGQYQKRYVFTEHHESHAASAFFPSPFEEAAILTMDGVGEWTTTSFGVGRGNKLELTHELHFPHSLGLLYSAFTQYCGFRFNSGEYKMMGLAPFGEPRFAGLILDQLLDLKDDGSFRLDMSYFDYASGLSMISRKFESLFGKKRREPESEITPHFMEVAASIQQVTEEVMVRCARHVRQVTGMKNLCLAGGVALNCVGNGRLLREKIFDDLWIQPAANDAGGALGVAQFIWHQLLEQPRKVDGKDRQKAVAAGPPLRSRCLPRHRAAGEGALPPPPLGRRTGPMDRLPNRGGQGRGLVARTNGIRTAGPRLPEHSRRPAQRKDATPHQPENQVPRILPPLCALCPARPRRRLVRLRTRP